MNKADTPNRAAYPKVKVRGDTGLTTILEKTEVLILRVVRSLTFTKVSLGTVHSASDGKVVKQVCSEPAPPLSSSSDSPKGKSSQGDFDDDTAKSRAAPILRPRAVLSSPDNDGMIGSMNRRHSDDRPHSKLQDPNNSNQSISTHRSNNAEETPRVKTGNVSKQGTGTQAHGTVSTRSSMSTQRWTETTETQRVYIMSPVTPAPPRSPVPRTAATPTEINLSETREATPTTQRGHVTRPVTPPTPRSPVSRPVTPTPRSPVTRPVTPLSPVTRPVARTPKSPAKRPVTPTPPKSPVGRRPVTPTPTSRATQSVVSAPRSPLTGPVTPTPRSPLTRPATPTQKLPVWR